MNLYDFTVKDKHGADVALSTFKGKALLIVNTATQCGFTPQYQGLQALYDTYKSQGFEILDFPCNQFGSQASGTSDEIAAFCELKYYTTFPQFAKIDVNGANAEPLYQYLKSQKGGTLTADIKWNFTKFLVDKSGQVVKRYGSAKKPENIAKDLIDIL